MLQPVLDKKRQCQLRLGSTSECGAAASSTDFFEELFVLEGHRSLIRISAKPDKYNVMRLTHDAAREVPEAALREEASPATPTRPTMPTMLKGNKHAASTR